MDEEEGWGDIADIGDLDVSVGSLSAGFPPERIDDIRGRTAVPTSAVELSTTYASA